MSNEILLDRLVTNTFTTLLEKHARVLYPRFYPEHGTITYDLVNECYLFNGFTEEEMRMIEVLIHSIHTHQAA